MRLSSRLLNLPLIIIKHVLNLIRHLDAQVSCSSLLSWTKKNQKVAPWTSMAVFRTSQAVFRTSQEVFRTSLALFCTSNSWNMQGLEYWHVAWQYSVPQNFEVWNTVRSLVSIPDHKTWCPECCQVAWQYPRPHWQYSGPHWQYSRIHWQYYRPQICEKCKIWNIAQSLRSGTLPGCLEVFWTPT